MSFRVGGARPGRRGFALAASIAAAVAFLPFVRGLAAGHVLYFRDLAILFHPYREFAAEGLRAGRVSYWDPYVHEGVPLVYPPVGYPVDLLQALWPGPRGFSLLLALHVPLAAAAFVLLGRRLGLSPVASATGALVYALGGFVLSTLNLYVYVQAAAWAPLIVLGLRAAGARKGALAGAAVATALALTSLGVEVALQAVAVGLVLAWRPRRPLSLVRALVAAALGMGLAAPVVLVMRANMAAGQRAHGFPIDVVLNQSVHPFTLVQVVVANLYGELGRLPDRWWGSNFFDRGFPYILSLYLGATVLALAVAGACSDRRRARRLVVVAAAALVVSLGRWGGLGAVLAAVPESWRVFRFPTKAYFTVHLCVALLAAVGVHALSRRDAARRVFVACALALGGALVLAPVLPRLLPAGAAWFVAHFFPPAVAAPTRAEYFAALLADAGQGGLLAVAAALVGGLALRRRIDARLAASLVAAVAVSDLVRAGGGLNPMAEPASLRTSAEVMARLRGLPGLQRVFTCHPEGSTAYWRARGLRPQAHEMLTLAAWADTLTPNFNRTDHVLSALGEDLTSLVPLDRLLPPATGCANVERLVPALRAAGVSHVLSLDPIAGPGLQPVAEIAVPRLAPLRVFVAAVSEPLPLRFVASSVRRGATPIGAVPSPQRMWIEDAPSEVDGARGSVHSLREEPDHIELEVEATRPTALVVLDGYFPGWRATVNGEPAPVLPAGTHRAVWVPAGRSLVQMVYQPRGLRSGLVLSALAAAAVMGIALRSRAVRARPPAQVEGGPAGGDRRLPSDSSTTWKTNIGL